MSSDRVLCHEQFGEFADYTFVYVIGVDEEKQWAQNTYLWGTRCWWYPAAEGLVDTNPLAPSGQPVPDPLGYTIPWMPYVTALHVVPCEMPFESPGK